jgi:hypothetical protein
VGEAVADLRSGERPVRPFHWEIEFPEVFSGNQPGFDAIVGNPPFMGGTRTSEVQGQNYVVWLSELHEQSSGRADLVAHFFRRAFNLIRKGGTFGLIATNTIGQGDTRATGLRYICTHGGTIFAARKRCKWPGQAAVIVSVVHVGKGDLEGTFLLDGRKVSIITAYLFDAGGHEEPTRLIENAGRSFRGHCVLGMGFTFDDSNPVATPISEMGRLIDQYPKNAEKILPYMGGEELNNSPTLSPQRYVIQFGELDEEEARHWPDLMGILEQRVRPERTKKDAKRYPRMVNEWWKFWNNRLELTQAVSPLQRVLAVAQVGNRLTFGFLPSKMIHSDQLIVFAFDTASAFAVLQSRAHEIWARFLASSMKDDLRYTPTDCFETFPFPGAWQSNHVLDAVGKTYYNCRADLMVRNNEGLTATCNRLNDPEEASPDILKLRELHDAMDRAVLDAYGWTDIRPTCEFLLDYEEEDDEEESSGRSRKKPWRYRWPDDIRDEVLARLLALNAKRAAEERRTGLAAAAAEAKTVARKPRRGGNRPAGKDRGPELGWT